MKKIMILFSLAFFLVAATGMAQTAIGTTVKEIAGTAADTLTASATKSYVLDLNAFKGKDSGVNLQIFTDLVSGTATFGYKYYWSMDGTNFPATAADSLTAAKSHASDYTKVLQITATPARYLKVSLIATAAAQKSTIYLKAQGYLK